MAEEKDDGSSDLSELKNTFRSLGYEIQCASGSTDGYGLPQNRKRLYVVALNVRDTKLFTFTDRSIELSLIHI